MSLLLYIFVGLSSFLIDNIDQMLLALTIVVPVDFDLLLWVAKVNGAESIFAQRMVRMEAIATKM